MLLTTWELATADVAGTVGASIARKAGPSAGHSGTALKASVGTRLSKHKAITKPIITLPQAGSNRAD